MFNSPSRWRSASLGELVVFKTGKLDSNAAVADGDYPFFTCSQETFRTNTFSFDVECVLLAGNNANGIFPLKYYCGKFDAYQRTYVITARDPNQLVVRFLYYSLRQKLSEFRSLSTGAATKFLTMTILNRTEIQLPPLMEQRRIASILGAYDDLIEVNRRRIVLLEEMARRLFDEWFVRFRFPGHESHEVVETEAGLLPNDWSVSPLSLAAKFVRGRGYRSVDLVETGGVPFVNLKCFLRDGGFKESGLKRYAGPYKPEHLLHGGDIVMAVTDMTQDRRIVGQAARVPRLDELPAIPSMDVVKIVPLPGVSKEFLYYWLRFSDFSTKAAQRANGANVLHLSPSAVADFQIVIPDKDTQALFAQHVGPINDQCDVLQATEKRLSASRDLLLPRLISGELAVSAAEHELEAVA